MTSTCKPTILLTVLAVSIALPAAAIAQNYSATNGDVAAKNWDAVVAYAQAWTQENGINPMTWYTVGQAYRSGSIRQPNAANTIPSYSVQDDSAPRPATATAEPVAFRRNGGPRHADLSLQ
jgi:hypothetical protein